MSNILPWLAANMLFLGIALAFIIFLIACLPLAAGWYLRRLFSELDHEPEPEPEPEPDEALMGDLPKLPDEAKRRAA